MNPISNVSLDIIFLLDLQTEDIIENGTVNGMTANDIQKILNLKHV